MRSIILATSLGCLAAAGATAAAPGTGAPSAGTQCNDTLSHLARPDKGAEYKKLTDLPPAEAFLAVFRRDANGCIVPVKATGRRSSAQPRR